MSSGEGSPNWTVFDGVKIVPSTPEALMAEINTAITNLEYARATAHLDSSSSSILKNVISDASVSSRYDAKMADEAYKAGCAALAAGKLDEALHSLNISLSKCPPDKTSAVAKLQSLISLTSQQLHKYEPTSVISISDPVVQSWKILSFFYNMSVFYHEEPPPPHYSKICKLLTAALKDAFSNCHSFNGRRSISISGPEEEYLASDSDDEQEVVVSEIRSRAMEKLRRKPSLIMSDSFSWVCFSCCSSAISKETYHSVKTNFSRCSSLTGLDFQDFRKLDFQDLQRSIIQELCYCQGWPFGLCRKAVLLPPLPKSPSESWSWRKKALE
ncbi:hypothetical protein EZV62_021542 [Acer yangbiense]|uniref:Uncharacterized protein n=1 Tax=Acer yangbiense TaxID=1000413 RepID=A0A5C7H5M9_9ROSI|nr:hypothetical protein EZV62_021542 [Acer yangbiense]